MAPGVFRTLSIQKLFLITIVLKIASSLAGWWFGSPWLLGFAVPLVLMLGYIALGLYRFDDTVSDEKFADSCYYLGFIFTISSILIALVDIPSIAAKIGDISVRFGAAMVSTVLGLIVRVYLVNFRPEFQDSVRIAEDGLLDAVRGFRIHLDLAVEKLRDFQNVTSDAFKLTVGQADLAIRDAAADHARHFGALSEQLAAENRALLEDSATHMKAATQTLSNALYDYAQTLVQGTGKFEANAESFSEKLDARLRGMALPEEYFAERLNPAIAKLGIALAEAGGQVSAMVSEIRENGRTMATAFAGISEKTLATSQALDRVRETVQSQAEAQGIAKEQIAVFRQLAQTIEKMETTVSRSLASIGAMEQAVRQMVHEAGEVIGSTREIGLVARKQTELTAGIEAAFADWLPRLQEADQRVSNQLGEAMQVFERATMKVATSVARQEAAMARVSEQLDGISARLSAASERALPVQSGGRRFGTDS